MGLEGWRLLPIAELADLQMGETLIAKDLTGDGIPVYSAGRAKEPWGFTSHARKRFQRGTIVVGARGSIGYPRLPTDDVFVCTQTTIAATPKQGTHPEFLAQALCAVDFSEVSAQQAVPMLTVAAFKEVEILTPPLAEQRKIAAILSSVDETIEKTEAVIAQLDVVKKAMLEELLTRGIPGRHCRFKQTEIGEVPADWSVHCMANVCSRIVVGIVVRPASYYVPAGVPCLRSKNVRADRIERSDLVFISEVSNDLLRKSKMRAGDVVTVRTGAPGVSAVVPSDLDGANCIDLIVSTPDRNRVTGGFLSRFINSNFGQGAIANRSGGLAQQHFNVGAMKEMLVPVPSIEEQGEIVSCLDSIDAQAQAEEVCCAALIAIKSSLSRALLTGELQVV